MDNALQVYVILTMRYRGLKPLFFFEFQKHSGQSVQPFNGRRPLNGHSYLNKSTVFSINLQWTAGVKGFNTLSANPANGQTHSNNSSGTAGELFECVWPFCGAAT